MVISWIFGFFRRQVSSTKSRSTARLRPSRWIRRRKARQAFRPPFGPEHLAIFHSRSSVFPKRLHMAAIPNMESIPQSLQSSTLEQCFWWWHILDFWVNYFLGSILKIIFLMVYMVKFYPCPSIRNIIPNFEGQLQNGTYYMQDSFSSHLANPVCRCGTSFCILSLSCFLGDEKWFG